jgi:hypothetical protein
MLIYIAFFVSAVIIYLMTYNKGNQSKVILAGYLAVVAIFVGIADMLGGYDRYIYGALFDEIAEMMRNSENILTSQLFTLYPKEVGYDFLNLAIGLFTQNRYVFIFVLTIIIYINVFFSLQKYTDNYPFATILFMGLWFFFTFTYLRQIIAASVAWLAIQYAIDRKSWQFFSIVFLAFLIHNSVIIFAPIYFLPMKKMSWPTVVVIMAVCLIIGVTNISDLLFLKFGALSGSEDRTGQYVTAERNGFRVDYLFEAVVFLGYILMRYKDIPNDKSHLMMLNMALVFCAILLIFIKSENGGRLSWFYIIGIISTLTYLATNRKDISFYSLSLILMTSLLFFRVLMTWGQIGILYPYKTFFTDGFREGDQTHEVYEYDHNYDVDKFYK